jgi:hypothetical protein
MMIKDLFSEDSDKLVAENDLWKLWKNPMTKFFQKELEEYDSDGFTLKGELMVVLAENKINGDRFYLAMDRVTQKPFADWTSSEEFQLKKALILMDRREELNLINMAERIQEETKCQKSVKKTRKTRKN